MPGSHAVGPHNVILQIIWRKTLYVRRPFYWINHKVPKRRFWRLKSGPFSVNKDLHVDLYAVWPMVWVPSFIGGSDRRFAGSLFAIAIRA